MFHAIFISRERISNFQEIFKLFEDHKNNSLRDFKLLFMATFSWEKFCPGNEKSPRDMLLSNVEKFLVGTSFLQQTFSAIISFLALLENCEPFKTSLQSSVKNRIFPFSLFPFCRSVSCYSILSQTTFIEIRGGIWVKSFSWKKFSSLSEKLEETKTKTEKFCCWEKEDKSFPSSTHLASQNHHQQQGKDNHWVEKWKEIF